MSLIIHQLPFLSDNALNQMALDIELAELCNRTPGQAYCRFYCMDPPAVTIGRNQAWRSVVDESFCERRGFDWVRRPTGGGALLHYREINYAVAASFDAFLGPGTRDFRRVYEMVMTAIAAGLETLGCRPVLNLGRSRTAGSSVTSAHGLCERSLTRYEILIEGRKAVASAQRNLANAFLQHGTIYLTAPCTEDQFWQDNRDAAPTEPGLSWWGFDMSLRPSVRTSEEVVGALERGLVQALGAQCPRHNTVPISSEDLSARVREWESDDWQRRR